MSDKIDVHLALRRLRTMRLVKPERPGEAWQLRDADGWVHDVVPEPKPPAKSATPEYSSWMAMITRCRYPGAARYARYGGRGIRVCDQWNPAAGGSFERFLADMGPRPAGTSIDRIDPDGHYEPGNCRWATASVQRTNRSEATKKPRKPPTGAVWSVPQRSAPPDAIEDSA